MVNWSGFGGLGLALVLTLFLNSVLYYAFARFTKPKADEENRLNVELEEAEKHL